MFPYLPGQRPVRMRRVELWFEAQGVHSVRNHEIEFVPDRDCECEDGSEECCERYFLTCVASEDWPCLFHGVIEYPFPFLCDERQVTIGDFLFPKASASSTARISCARTRPVRRSAACRGSPLATATVRH